MRVHSLQGKLFPKAPFDFSKSLDFVSMFAPSEGEQTVSSLSITKAIYLENQTLAFSLKNEGTVLEPVLTYTLYSPEEIDEEIKYVLLDRIRFYLSLDDDLKPFYDMGSKDLKFAPLLEDLYGLHQVKFLTPFEAAAWAVLSQRISMKVANKIKNKLTDTIGNIIRIEGVDYRSFPSARQIKNLGVENLISIVKNERKSEYLIAVAEAFDRADENFLRHGKIGEVKEWLMNIRGIGEWSAHLELIRGLGRMEELPEHDQTLVNCFKKFYGREATEEQLKIVADGYGNYKGYWVYYLRTVC
ncbi:MAG: DNA-3-methyladenine glycosylase [Euryarchaeota archaeon]|nr:DNA-3-methyladenine glycosylase [Euryarchaeota archaeon]